MSQIRVLYVLWRTWYGYRANSMRKNDLCIGLETEALGRK